MSPFFEAILDADRALTLAFNGSESLYLDALAVTATRTVVWLPLALAFLYVVIRNNNLPAIFLTVFGVALCVLLSDQIASSLFKPLVARFRPAQDPHLMYLVRVVNDYRGGQFGFFSSHAANTVSVALFVSLVTRYWRLSVALGAWVLLNCWTRVYLGVHYVGDVLAGLFCGLMVGALVWLLWRRLSLRFAGEGGGLRRTACGQAALTAGGYSVRSLEGLMAVLCATFLYIAFRALFVAV